MTTRVATCIVENDYGNASHGGTCCVCGGLMPVIPADVWRQRFRSTDRNTDHYGLPRGVGMRALHVDVWCEPGSRMRSDGYFGVQACSEGCAIQFIAWAEEQNAAELRGERIGPGHHHLCPAHG